MNLILQGTKAKVNAKESVQPKEKGKQRKTVKVSKKEQVKKEKKEKGQRGQKKVQKEVVQRESEAKVQIKPVEQTVLVPPAQIVKQPQVRMVTVRYSHYKSKFQVIDNFLTFAQIDQDYSLSFVFKGNFQPVLRPYKDPHSLPFSHGGWTLGLQDDYQLQIIQDQQAEALVERKAYVAPKAQPLKKNRMDELTAELKGLSVEELQAKGQNYRRLIQQRDLQDILFK